MTFAEKVKVALSKSKFDFMTIDGEGIVALEVIDKVNPELAKSLHDSLIGLVEMYQDTAIDSYLDLQEKVYDVIIETAKMLED